MLELRCYLEVPPLVSAQAGLDKQVLVIFKPITTLTLAEWFVRLSENLKQIQPVLFKQF